MTIENIKSRWLRGRAWAQPNMPYLSPSKVGDFFGFRVQELAERAHVHRNTPTARPQAPQLQKYLQDMVRVLAVVTEMTGDVQRAVFLITGAFEQRSLSTRIAMEVPRAELAIAIESWWSGHLGYAPTHDLAALPIPPFFPAFEEARVARTALESIIQVSRSNRPS